MNELLQKLTERASDAGELAKSLTESSLKSVNEVFRGTPLFGALSATATENAEFDETHYLLVPLWGSERAHAIYTKRILPPDIGATNSLPKLRVFHVPDEAGKELLEQELIQQAVSEKAQTVTGSSEFADLLDQVADQIDNETQKLSGGLLIIGGAVALVNPLVGIGIAVKGLLPSVGAKASKAGAGLIGNKLRDWNKQTSLSKARKESSRQVRKLKPQLFTNPLIRSLEAIATEPGTSFDPSFDPRNWIDQFERPHYHLLTEEAIREIYRDHLPTANLTNYQQSHLEWVRSIIDR
ncbi:hypothetical protein [Roseibacillus persicicus]|uniref:hypothetical protein n=1 Tax=Roseibacillus persicicus TaxID=454148 RepID=UPI00280F5994|nr:hypothetical protein [Roseibacillus persicicus]MDQ8189029.1 hypothetical protein [Roseibacillus persicicus]